MPLRNGASLATCMASAGPSRVDELGSSINPAIAKNPHRPRVADGAIRRPQGRQDRQAGGAVQGAQEGAAGAVGGTVTEQPAPTGHIYSRKDFTWDECPDGWALHAIGHRSAIVHVVPDGVWPGMWRIRHPDGRLSDMANLTWVKDGAIAMAMRLLDPRRGLNNASPAGRLCGRNR